MKLPARAHGPQPVITREDPLLAHKLEDAGAVEVHDEETTISASGRARVAASNARRTPQAV